MQVLNSDLMFAWNHKCEGSSVQNLLIKFRKAKELSASNITTNVIATLQGRIQDFRKEGYIPGVVEASTHVSGS